MSYDSTPGPTAGNAASGPGYPPPADYPADYPAGMGPRPSGPGWGRAPVAAGRANGLAVGGFVCAAVGGVAAFIPYAGILAFPVLAVGLVLCAIGMTRGPVHRGLAVAGLVVALVGLPVDAVVTSATLNAGTPTASSTSTPGAGSPYASSPSGGSSSTGASSGSGYPGSSTSGSSGYPSSGGYSSSSSGYSAADQAYLATLSHYGVTGGSDSQAISLGHSVCGYLARGGTPAGAAGVIADNGFDSTDASVIVGAAEGAYCSN